MAHMSRVADLPNVSIGFGRMAVHARLKILSDGAQVHGALHDGAVTRRLLVRDRHFKRHRLREVQHL